MAPDMATGGTVHAAASYEDAAHSSSRRWITIRYLSTCVHCHTLIQRGSSVFPGQARGYYHAHCAEQLHANGILDLNPPVCRHFSTRGYCLLGDACFFQHPDPARSTHGADQAPRKSPDSEAAETLPHCTAAETLPDGTAAGHEQQASIQAASTLDAVPAVAVMAGPGPVTQAPAAKKVTNDATRRQNRGAGRRNKVRNDWRASALRQWMIHTWGRHKLSQGGGVLDVGGGKGDLAFELLNLNGIPASLVDPRPLDMASAARRLRLGVYAQSVAFQDVNQDACAVRPDMLPAHKRNAKPQHAADVTISKVDAAGTEQLPSQACAPPPAAAAAGPRLPCTLGTNAAHQPLLQPVQSQQSAAYGSEDQQQAAPSSDVSSVVGASQAWVQPEQLQQTCEQLQKSCTTSDAADSNQASDVADGGQAHDVADGGQATDAWLFGSPHRTPGQLRILLTYPVIQAAAQYQQALQKYQQRCGQWSSSTQETQLLPLLHPQGGAPEAVLGLQGCGDQMAQPRNAMADCVILPSCQVCGWPAGLNADALMAVHKEMTAAARMTWTRQGLSADLHEQPYAACPVSRSSQVDAKAAQQQKDGSGDAEQVWDARAAQHMNARTVAAAAAAAAAAASSHGMPGSSIAEGNSTEHQIGLEGCKGTVPQVLKHNEVQHLSVVSSATSTTTGITISSDQRSAVVSRPASQLWWHQHSFPAKVEPEPVASGFECDVQHCHTCGASWHPAMHGQWAQAKNSTSGPDTHGSAGIEQHRHSMWRHTSIHESHGSAGAGQHQHQHSAWQQELRVLHTLASCSAVVAMHADQATEPAVDLAIALGKPWAVVPCCVYSSQFPGRRLHDGTHVTTYEQLVAYLLQKQHNTQLQALPIEGKNLLVWADRQ